MLPFMTTRRFYQIIKYKKYNGELGISDCKNINSYEKVRSIVILLTSRTFNKPLFPVIFQVD